MQHRPSGWYAWHHRALGVVLFMAFAPLLPDVSQLFGAASLFDIALLRLHPQGYGWSVYDLAFVVGRYTGWPASLTVYALSAFYLATCVSLIAGRQVRVAALVLLLLHHIFFVAVPVYSYGFDFLALSALFYCAVYHRLWAGHTLRLLQLHLCLVYFFGGLNKAIGATWHNGEALWRALQQPIGAPLIRGVELMQWPWLCTALGWAVVVLELSYAVLVWRQALRPWVVAATVAMHTGIALCLGLYAFSALMILLNLTAFYFPYAKHSPCPRRVPPEQATACTGVRVIHRVEALAPNASSTTTAGAPPEKPP